MQQFKNYDCLGHLDILKRYLDEDKEPDYDIYREGVRAILKQIIADGKGLEVNTSGFRHGKGAPYPSYDILKEYKALGGTLITTGSDAHQPQDLAVNYLEVYKTLKEIGFRYVCVFSNREPTMKTL